jgi:hypothetical protein
MKYVFHSNETERLKIIDIDVITTTGRIVRRIISIELQELDE